MDALTTKGNKKEGNAIKYFPLFCYHQQ